VTKQLRAFPHHISITRQQQQQQVMSILDIISSESEDDDGEERLLSMRKQNWLSEEELKSIAQKKHKKKTKRVKFTDDVDNDMQVENDPFLHNLDAIMPDAKKSTKSSRKRKKGPVRRRNNAASLAKKERERMAFLAASAQTHFYMDKKLALPEKADEETLNFDWSALEKKWNERTKNRRLSHEDEEGEESEDASPSKSVRFSAAQLGDEDDDQEYEFVIQDEVIQPPQTVPSLVSVGYFSSALFISHPFFLKSLGLTLENEEDVGEEEGKNETATFDPPSLDLHMTIPTQFLDEESEEDEEEDEDSYWSESEDSPYVSEGEENERGDELAYHVRMLDQEEDDRMTEYLDRLEENSSDSEEAEREERKKKMEKRRKQRERKKLRDKRKRRKERREREKKELEEELALNFPTIPIEEKEEEGKEEEEMEPGDLSLRSSAYLEKMERQSFISSLSASSSSFLEEDSASQDMLRLIQRKENKSEDVETTTKKKEGGRAAAFGWKRKKRKREGLVKLASEYRKPSRNSTSLMFRFFGEDKVANKNGGKKQSGHKRKGQNGKGDNGSGNKSLFNFLNRSS